MRIPLRTASVSLLAALALITCASAQDPAVTSAPSAAGESVATTPKTMTSETERNSVRHGLTAVEGIRVGQVTLDERPTGCSVILADGGATGAVEVRGGAPATRETDLLRPENLVSTVHAVVLSGGSAYGLDAASGVMRYLEERNVGFPVRGAVVPIVVGASLLDLGVGEGSAATRVRPDAACGYRAATIASGDPVREGNVGAGAGATAGKLRGLERAVKAGVGSAELRFDDGLVVAALVAVNAVGDIIDPDTGEVVAGVRSLSESGPVFSDARKLLRQGATVPGGAGENTTIGVVATNATLTKAQAFKVAQMAHAGYARSLVPAHALFDGDAIFVLATGKLPPAADAEVSRIGAVAADVVARSVVRSALAATSLPGLPAARDLPR